MFFGRFLSLLGSRCFVEVSKGGYLGRPCMSCKLLGLVG